MKIVHSLNQQLCLRFYSGLDIAVRDVLVGSVLVLLTVVLFVVSLAHGLTNTGLVDLWQLIRGFAIDPQASFALLNVRLPRFMSAFFVGWCVALSGAILQPMARNPLADPGLFGISQGSMTLTMVLLVFLPTSPKILVIGASLIGGFAVVIVLLALVGNARADGFALLLMGIALTSLLAALNAFLVLYVPQEASYNIANWLAGSLFQADWAAVFTLMPLWGISLFGILLAGRSLKRYELGNELALALGEPLRFSRPILLLFAVLLNAGAVTIVGPLAFLAILSAQITEVLSRATGAIRLFLCAFVGANLVIVADMVSKSGFMDLGLPLGLSFTLVGVPLFIVVLHIANFRRS